MKSKILAAVPDPASPLSSIYIAESAGCVRRVNLSVRELLMCSSYSFGSMFCIVLLSYALFMLFCYAVCSAPQELPPD